MNKGQISLYIIAGIIVVLFMVFITLNINKLKQIKAETGDSLLKQQSDQVTHYIQQCLFDAAEKGIFLIGYQGGYVDPEYNEHYGDYDEVPFVQNGPFKIPYWYINGKDISPTLDKIEKKLGRFVLVEMQNCTNFSSFNSFQGIEILLPETNYQADFFTENNFLNVTINSNDISLDYYLPVVLKQGNTERKVNSYHIDLILPYKADFELAKKLMKKMIDAKPGSYDLDCKEMTREGYTNTYPYGNFVMIFDYESYFDPLFEKSLAIQFAYDGISVQGYCSG